ncbi:hypothetical protein UFOVP135_22 [uncultured Caudovirales phage]|uniref:Uncharacterized protein n=1 Tax=uncultured Caudovirales phage TaxID=2100421 RepID=A0A6J5LFS0_9CAUD|nr:hypothetical protein UFOVP135_22 [uncultured Caudovirales phage]
MPHFKNVENKIHWLDDGVDPLVWLPNCTLITDEEAKAIQESQKPIVTYAQKRAAEYPSFADQFDLLYHGGMDAWKAAIQTVKDKYPKA